ncbi:Ornithine carbamoyltransferase [Actinidia chinensis var. chinensis]|uniref:Ornithine carbamoyltransferase n=1 Tax=Actinidia chinensis var. chinensis TaxID=1590841 RepID=A0A2R6QE46_ACTCC|nr:Ornithine carbamoyltransferase [Actinidia chinensis var. chinensis]
MTMMETLVVVAQHQNQYNSRSRAQGPVRLGSIVSPPSRGFSDINCRTFHSRAGILPSPLTDSTSPITKQACSYSSSPKTPSPPANYPHSEKSKHLKKSVKSSITPISSNVCVKKEVRYDKFPYSELWAGPAYSNSPPPSSLPIPKFSLHAKRTVSLDLPSSSATDINFHAIAKSAPASPTRDHSNSSFRDFVHSDDSATRTLRRILNLDIADE